MRRLTHQRYPGAAYSTIAYPPEWEGAAAPKKWAEKASFKAKDVAKRRNEAERVRLLYVAATRAAELLLINVEGEDRSFWAPAVSTTAAEDANAAGAGQTLLCRYPDAFGCLLPGKVPQTASAGNAPIPPSSAAANRTTVSAIPAVNGFALERSIAERAGKLAQTRYFAITPSGLDHGAYAPTRADRAADAEDGTPAAPTVLQDRTEEVGGDAMRRPLGYDRSQRDGAGGAARRSFALGAGTVCAGGGLPPCLLNGAPLRKRVGHGAWRERDRRCMSALRLSPKKPPKPPRFFLRRQLSAARSDGRRGCYPELPFTLCETDSDSACSAILTSISAERPFAGEKD